MACVLTHGESLDCREGVGGIKELYIIELANVSAITESSGIVTAITKVSGKRFWKYAQVRETSNTNETLAGNLQNGTLYYDQSVNIVINNRQATRRNEIMLLAKNNLIIVAVENQVDSSGNNKSFLYGRVNGLQLQTGEAPSGTTWADRNGYTLTFQAQEVELAPEVTYSLLAGLETPG